MDILDPLQSGTDIDIVETKVIIDEIPKFTSKDSMEAESDDEQNVVDHLSPQTLLETPGEDVHYSLRSSDGIVTYGVLKVDEGGVDSVSVPQIVTTSNNFTGAGVQVLPAGNLNGQLYVITNPNQVFSTQSTPRTIASRSPIVEPNTTIVTRKRDERRRATHNEVERRRRDKINNWISKLAKIMPDSGGPDSKGSGPCDGQSKGCILAKACQYIMDLRDNDQKLATCMEENKELSHSIEALKRKNSSLEAENRVLKQMLKQSGIAVPESISDQVDCDILPY